MRPSYSIKFIIAIALLLSAFILFNSCKKSKNTSNTGNTSTWLFNGYKIQYYTITDSFPVLVGADTEMMVVDSLADSNINITNLSMQITTSGDSFLIVKNLIDETVCGFPYGNGHPDSLALIICLGCSGYNYFMSTSCHTGLGINVSFEQNGNTATLIYSWLIEVQASNVQYVPEKIYLQGTRQ